MFDCYICLCACGGGGGGGVCVHVCVLVCMLVCVCGEFGFCAFESTF